MIEILSPSGHFPASQLIHIRECHISAEYDRDIRGYTFNLRKPQSCLSYPFKKATSLGLRQALIVFQLKVVNDRQFNLELSVSTTNGCHYILHFSSSFKTIRVKNLCCQIPWHNAVGSVWKNYVLNIAYYVSHWFPGNAQLARVDSLCLRSSHCSLRKIFSLEYPSDGCKLVIPETMDFPSVMNAGTILRSPELDQKVLMEKTRTQEIAPACRIRARLSEARQLALSNQATDTSYDIQNCSSSLQIPSVSFQECSLPPSQVEKETHTLHTGGNLNLNEVQFNDSESSKSEVEGSVEEILNSTSQIDKVAVEVAKIDETSSTLTIDIDDSSDQWIVNTMTTAASKSSVQDIQQGLVKYLWIFDIEMTQFLLEYGPAMLS